MKRYLISLFVCLIGMSLIGAKKAPLLSLQEKNKRADTAFLKWRLEAPGSELLECKKILTPEAQAFLVEESQLPLTRYLSKKALKAKVHAVMADFLTRFGAETPIQKRQLEELVTEIIMPEYEFQIDTSLLEEPDKAYNELLDGLSRYKTVAGTFLNEWALRYLTSESQFVALSIIERETLNGKHFNELSDAQKGEILTLAGEVVTRRFINNLGPVRRKFGFRVPPHADMAVKKRVDLFLRAKFGL